MAEAFLRAPARFSAFSQGFHKALSGDPYMIRLDGCYEAGLCGLVGAFAKALYTDSSQKAEE
jgi:hypothetical protein